MVFYTGNAGSDRVCRRRTAHADADRGSRSDQGPDFGVGRAEKPKVNFEVGETIKINNGPFLNFSGVIEEIEPERGKLKVTVNIFGRNTPVELEYWQVEKA